VDMRFAWTTQTPAHIPQQKQKQQKALDILKGPIPMKPPVCNGMIGARDSLG